MKVSGARSYAIDSSANNQGPMVMMLSYHYGNLVEAMEALYGERHLEYVFRAQLKERVQSISESLNNEIWK